MFQSKEKYIIRRLVKVVMLYVLSEPGISDNPTVQEPVWGTVSKSYWSTIYLNLSDSVSEPEVGFTWTKMLYLGAQSYFLVTANKQEYYLNINLCPNWVH